MLWSKLFTSLLFLIVILAGCVDTRVPKVGIPDVKISEPYNVNQNVISFRTDIDISIPIENIRKDSANVKIINAQLVVNMRNGSKEYIFGYSPSISLAPEQTLNLSILFRDVPVIVQLKEKPLRFSSDINSYDVAVQFKGTIKILGIVPYSKSDTYTKTITVDELPIDKEIFMQFLK